jgi:hypothetical protein
MCRRESQEKEEASSGVSCWLSVIGQGDGIGGMRSGPREKARPVFRRENTMHSACQSRRRNCMIVATAFLAVLCVVDVKDSVIHGSGDLVRFTGCAGRSGDQFCIEGGWFEVGSPVCLLLCWLGPGWAKPRLEADGAKLGPLWERIRSGFGERRGVSPPVLRSLGGQIGCRWSAREVASRLRYFEAPAD